MTENDNNIFQLHRATFDKKKKKVESDSERKNRSNSIIHVLY